VRRLTGGKGEVGKKVQELTTVLGVAGIQEGRCRDDGSTEDRAGMVGSRGGGGVAAAGVQKGNGKGARKLLRVDVVLVVSSVRAKRGRSAGTTVWPSSGGVQGCRAAFWLFEREGMEKNWSGSFSGM
jgi:hypothetical protein